MTFQVLLRTHLGFKILHLLMFRICHTWLGGMSQRLTSLSILLLALLGTQGEFQTGILVWSSVPVAQGPSVLNSVCLIVLDGCFYLCFGHFQSAFISLPPNSTLLQGVSQF